MGAIRKSAIRRLRTGRRLAAASRRLLLDLRLQPGPGSMHAVGGPCPVVWSSRGVGYLGATGWTAATCMSGVNTRYVFLPAALAEYMARSALRISSSHSTPAVP